MSGPELAFAVLALLTTGGAVAAVSARRPGHAGLWLVVALAALGGCFLVLGAELVAFVHLIGYVGAVVVLVVLALVLTRGAEPGDAVDHPWPHRVGAAVVAVATTLLLAITLIGTLGGGRVVRAGPTSAQVGEQVFGTWVWPFELLSVLLLVSLVAGLAVAGVGHSAGRHGEAGVAAEVEGGTGGSGSTVLGHPRVPDDATIDEDAAAARRPGGEAVS